MYGVWIAAGGADRPLNTSASGTQPNHASEQKHPAMDNSGMHVCTETYMQALRGKDLDSHFLWLMNDFVENCINSKAQSNVR